MFAAGLIPVGILFKVENGAFILNSAEKNTAAGQHLVQSTTILMLHRGNPGLIKSLMTRKACFSYAACA